jgi:hypothetical protein
MEKMTLKEKGSVADTTRRAVLHTTAVVGSFAAASLIAPGVAHACHTYRGPGGVGCWAYRRDKAAGRLQSSSSSSSSPSSSSTEASPSNSVASCSSDQLPYGGQFYGCHVGGGGIGNLPVKRSTPVAQRFRAEASGYVTSVKLVQKYTSNTSNYSSGDGGALEVTLRPSLDGSVLGTTGVISSPKSRGQHPTYRFKQNVYLQKGKTYYLQFTNASSSSFLSINCLHSGKAPKPLSAWPYQGNTLTSFRKESGRWVEKANHCPIFDLYYTNGLVKGNGWYQGVRKDPHSIGGEAAVRQSFMPNRTMRVKAVSLKIFQRRRSSSNMNVALKDSDGKILTSSTLSRYNVMVASSDYDTITWNTVNFGKTVTLSAGKRYYVVCEAPSGSHYAAVATQNGSRYFKFNCDKSKTFGRDGRAEYTYNGRSWSGFTHHGKRNRPDCDIGCLLHLA